MNYKVVLYLILISFTPFIISMNARDSIEQQLETYEALYRAIQTTKGASPALIRNVFEETRRLDELINSLPDRQRDGIATRAKRIQLQYQNAFRRSANQYMRNSFHMDLDKIYKIIGATTVAAMSAASISFAYFWLQQQTGNIEAIDQTKLVVAGLEGMVAELVRQGFEQYNVRVGNIAAEISKNPIMSIMSASSAMIVHQKTLIARPTKTGVLMAGLKTEFLVICNDVIEKEGGVVGILRNIKIPKLLFGTSMMSAQQQQFVTYLRPAIQTMFVSPKVQQAFIQILSVATESALVGIFVYYIGLGFADEQSIYNTLVGGAFRGLIEGSLAYIMQRSGGALPTTSSGFLSRAVQNELIKDAGLAVTSADVATVLIEKSVQTAVQYSIDESGGLGNFTKSIIGKTARAVNQKWWIPFKDICLQTCDTMLDWVGVLPRVAQ